MPGTSPGMTTSFGYELSTHVSVGLRHPLELSLALSQRARRYRWLYRGHRRTRACLRSVRRIRHPVALSRGAPARAHLHRGVPLHADPGAADLVLLRAADPGGCVEMTPITASALALSLYGGSFYSEIIRGGIISIDRGQSEAGAALGMTPGQSMRRIVLPQAIKRMIPALMNQSIIQFKNTSLVSVLAVPDLVYQSQVAAHDSYRPLETYTAVAVAYAAILIPLTILARRGEKRLAVGE